jgi:hypothetical protein
MDDYVPITAIIQEGGLNFKEIRVVLDEKVTG